MAHLPLHRFTLFLLLAFLAACSAQAEMVTLVNGDLVEADRIEFGTDQLKLTMGTETRMLPRAQVRDVAFSGRKREQDVLATDTQDLQAMLKRGQELLARFPDSMAVMVHDESEFVHRPDGTNVIRARVAYLLAKEEALGVGQVGLGFDPVRQRLKVLYARSFSPDGEVSALSADQIKISKGSSGGEYFNQNQQVSFTIPGTKVGCLVDYAYEFEEFNPFDKNLFQGSNFFQGQQPVALSVMRVLFPKDVPLNFKAYRLPEAASKPVITEKGEYTQYEWKMENLPPIISEPYMPPMRDIVPVVVFCRQKDWKFVNDRLQPMFIKRFQLTDVVKKKVDEIIAGATTVEDKIGRLYLFCQKEIRYISIKGNLASNQVGHPAEETLKNRYGDCTDKGMLLATMLKHIGVEAYPVGVLTNDSGRSFRELPIFDSNHCITEVNLNGKRFYLDSTATDYRYPYFRSDDHDTIAENNMRGSIDPIPVPPPEDNAVQGRRNLKIEPDGTMLVELDNLQNGSWESSMRGMVRNLKPEEYEKQARASIAGLTASYTLHLATFTNPLDFSGPFKTKSSYTLHRYVPRSGRYLILEIPFFQLRFSEVSLAERTYDIVYTTSNLRDDQITIQLPPGMKVKYLPLDINVKTPALDYSCLYKNEGPSIKITRRLAVKQRVVPVATYLEYKTELEKIARSTDERIFLEDAADKGETR